MVFIHRIFYTFLELRFPDVETNPGPQRRVPGACRILCSNVLGLSRNLSFLTVAWSQYDLLLFAVRPSSRSTKECSETLVTEH